MLKSTMRTLVPKDRSAVLALIVLLTALLAHSGAPAQTQRSDPSADTAGNRTPDARSSQNEDDIDKLKVVVAVQQKRIDQLEQTLADQKKLIEQVLHISSAAPGGGNKTAVTAGTVADPVTPSQPAATVPIQKPPADEPSSLTLRIGNVSITPYGFLDLTTIIRDKDIASGLATNLGSIPFSNTVSGNLSEFHFTAQNTRLGLRFDAHHGGVDFLGLVETDFAGFSPGNVAVTTNSNGLRIRLGWLDIRKNKWELLGGQSWSLITPNRKGTSPIPADIFSTQNIDQSIQVGLTWARQPQFRVIYHASGTVTLALSLEAAEQYGGGSAGAGVITLPPALADSYPPQLDLGGSTFAAPNLHPDVIGKAAFDPKVGGRDLHFEVAGLLSSFALFDPRNQVKHYKTGGGISAGLNFEAFKNFRLIGNGFYSDGGGRYIFGLAPDLIVNADGSASLVHSASTVDGIEYQINGQNLFDAYYGGAYIDRSIAVDTNGQFVGYGFPGSPLNHNRSLQQITFGYTHTFWRDVNYGALQFISQYSYLVRHPWSVPAGQPGIANTNFIYLSFRYILPGAPPAKPGR
jgi:hypothetical protein